MCVHFEIMGFLIAGHMPEKFAIPLRLPEFCHGLNIKSGSGASSPSWVAEMSWSPCTSHEYFTASATIGTYVTLFCFPCSALQVSLMLGPRQTPRSSDISTSIAAVLIEMLRPSEVHM